MKNIVSYILIIVFSVTVIIAVGSGIFGNSELEQREERLQEIVAEKGQYRTFFNNQKRFYDETTVAPERRDELREFQKAVAASPERENLEQTLSGYHYWLASLTPTERSNLQRELQQPELSNSERVEKIKQIIEGGQTPLPIRTVSTRSSDEELAQLLADSTLDRKHYLLGLPPGEGPQRLFWELEFQKYYTPQRPFGPDGGGGFRPGGGRSGGGPGGPGGGGGPNNSTGGGNNPPGSRPENAPPRGSDRNGPPEN